MEAKCFYKVELNISGDFDIASPILMWERKAFFSISHA